MKQTRFGIFLPVRNGAEYVHQAIQSIITQNRKDWTLFVLDNASSDGTAEIVSAFNHPQIYLYKSSSALPIWESWHRIWWLLVDNPARVEFATIIGHDDILLPSFLDSINHLIIDQPRASLYQVGFDMIDGNGNLIRPCRPIPIQESSEGFLAARLWGLRDSVGTGYVFRPSDYVVVGGIPNFPSLLYADDLLFARLARISYKAAIPNSECLYRLHRASTSYQLTVKRIRDQICALNQYIDALTKEFPIFIESRLGRDSISSLLAREILILIPIAKKWLIGHETLRYLLRLEALYYVVSRVYDYRQWLGTNFASRTIYVYLKSINLLYILLKDKYIRH